VVTRTSDARTTRAGAFAAVVAVVVASKQKGRAGTVVAVAVVVVAAGGMLIRGVSGSLFNVRYVTLVVGMLL
jgi:hypothetical protein